MTSPPSDSPAFREKLIPALRSKAGKALIVHLLSISGLLACFGSLGLGTVFLTGSALALTLLAFSAKSRENIQTLFKRFMIAGDALLLTCVLGEIALRLPALTNRVQPEAMSHAAKLTRDDYDTATWTIWRGMKFRSRHLDKPKAADVFRILTLGDSFTWGQNIADTSVIWPYVLEQEFATDERRTEVVNLALPGNTAVNNLEHLESHGWELEPDLVILQYLINDPLPSGAGFQRETIEWMHDPGVPLLLRTKAHNRLLRTSYFYSALNGRWSALQRKLFNLRDLEYSDLHADGFEHWEATKNAFDRFADETKARDTKALVVMFPIFEHDTKLDETYPYTPLHKKLRKEMEARNLPFLDLLPIYAAENPDVNAWRVNPADSHPSAEAHRLAAGAIADFLRAN